MNNFLDFIKKDIELKKEELSLMPLKSKKGQKAYNDKINQIADTYTHYKHNLVKYFKQKIKKMEIKDSKDRELIEKIKNEIEILEYDMKYFNIENTHYEKSDLDINIYILEHFDEFNFKFLMKNIEVLLYKFDEVGVQITKDDFFYNVYVCKYMEEFIKVSNTDKKYESLLSLFEQYYWIDSNLIYNIALNFRELINKYKRFFMKKIDVTRLEIVNKYDVSSFKDCEEELLKRFVKLHELTKETIVDVIDKSKLGEIDIKNYLGVSKVKNEIIAELTINPIDLENENEQKKFYKNIYKLKRDLQQYIDYNQFLAVINVLKKDYNDYVKEPSEAYDAKKLEDLEKKKIVKEKLLKRYKNELLTSNILFKKKNNVIEKRILQTNVQVNKELKDIYHQINIEKMKTDFINKINGATTMNDILFYCYSQENYKKSCLKRAYPEISYKELLKKIKEFDYFAIDPTLALIDNIPFLREYNLEKVIANKHKLNNINLDEEALKDAEGVLYKVDFLLREKLITESDINAEDIDFITKISNIILKEESVKED